MPAHFLCTSTFKVLTAIAHSILVVGVQIASCATHFALQWTWIHIDSVNRFICTLNSSFHWVIKFASVKTFLNSACKKNYGEHDKKIWISKFVKTSKISGQYFMTWILLASDQMQSPLEQILGTFSRQRLSLFSINCC